MAKKFTFRLNPLLNLRKQNTQISKQELARAINERANKEMQIEEVHHQKMQLNQASIEKMQLQELQAMVNHKRALSNELEKLAIERNSLLEKEHIKQLKYNSALQQEKVILKLKEKKEFEYKQIIDKEEQKDLDEIGLRINNNNEKI